MLYEDVVKWWQNKNLTSVNDYMSALENFQIIFTCNSNNIEGSNLTYHTTKEIFEESNITTSGILPRQVFEVQNQKFAFMGLLRCLERRIPISIPLIKKVHKTMLYGCYDKVRWEKGERPGEFKKGDYCVGFVEIGSPPEFVEEDMKELIEEVNSSNGDAITVATYFHVKFEAIHGFADGNGRVGRTLLNYYLMLRNYPPMVIYNEDRNTYYLGLEVFDRTEKLNGLIQFFKEQTIKTWKNRIERRLYTQEQIRLARKLAPDCYKNLSDDELWKLVGNYVLKL